MLERLNALAAHLVPTALPEPWQTLVGVPLRVVINECIELAKSFGGTDGHKYVNGVLHKLGQKLRAAEAGLV